MLTLALWLKRNGFRADQVQAFLPSPMATATAMYHTGKNPLRKVTRASETVYTAKKLSQRRLHKAFLRYHDPDNWPTLREALKRMGRADLIGPGKHCLVPAWQPATYGGAQVPRKPSSGRHKPHAGRGERSEKASNSPEGTRRKVSAFRTQHTRTPVSPATRRSGRRSGKP